MKGTYCTKTPKQKKVICDLWSKSKSIPEILKNRQIRGIGLKERAIKDTIHKYVTNFHEDDKITGKNPALSLIINNVFHYHHKTLKKGLCDLIEAISTSDTLEKSCISRSLAAIRDIKGDTSYTSISDYLNTKDMFDDDVMEQYFNFLTKDQTEVILSLDWTYLKKNNHSSLVLALVLGKNSALPICTKTLLYDDSKGKKVPCFRTIFRKIDKWNIHNKKIIILSDREFGSVNFLNALNKHDFYYCIRTKNNILIKKGKGRVLGDDKTKNKNPTKEIRRIWRKCNVFKGIKVPTVIKHWKPGKKEVHYYLSNIPDITIDEACTLYGKRWNIETMFRTTKDSRYGFAFKRVMYQKNTRVTRDRMWFLISLSFLFLNGLGEASNQMGYSYKHFHQFSKKASKNRKRPRFTLIKTGFLTLKSLSKSRKQSKIESKMFKRCFKIISNLFKHTGKRAESMFPP